jgi:DNA invertase Pin-like site-specific DNA recombinase
MNILKGRQIMKNNRHAAPATLRRIEERYPKSLPGKASDYIAHFKELAQKHPHMKVILYARVSARTQDHNGNLDEQLASLRKAVQPHKVISEFKTVESGWQREHLSLQGAAEMALEVGAVVVAESADRFLRSEKFDTKKNPSILPTVAEYEKLKKIVGVATLATIAPPDNPWKANRGLQTKRGQTAKDNKGGRPLKVESGYKKNRRKKKLPIVARLYRQGLRVSEIVVTTSVPRSTIVDWIFKYCDK